MKQTRIQVREQKKVAAARRMASHDRANLLVYVGEICTLLPKEESIRLAGGSETVGTLLRGIAAALERQSGTERPGHVKVLGALCDMAETRMLPHEKNLPFDTPSEILRWFVLYLERTLSETDLRLT